MCSPIVKDLIPVPLKCRSGTRAVRAGARTTTDLTHQKKEAGILSEIFRHNEKGPAGSERTDGIMDDGIY